MRIFVGEYVCGGGLAGTPVDDIPSCLRREGSAMLRAIVSDLSKVAETVVPIDSRFAAPEESTHVVEVGATPSFWGQWAAAAKDCDSALIVAPESNGMLAKGIGMLRAGGVDVIAGSGDFLRVASDKQLTAKAMHTAGITHPMYMTTTERRFAKKLQDCNRFVVKPRDGCGTQEIQIVESYDEALSLLTDNMIMQQWLPGQAISIALVASGTRQTFLPAVSQKLCDTTCEYAGGSGPLDEDVQRRATAIASRAIAAMPPTAKGFVGLDLLIANRPSEDCVIEINPRLTTSYVGIRKMIEGNLSARLFDLESGPVTCCAGTNTVRWTAEGSVWVDDTAVANV